MNIIDRLARNAQKQKEYRHLVRGRSSNVSYRVAKRIADIYFLHKYAGLSTVHLSRMYGVTHQRIWQIANLRSRRDGDMEFTICHPKRSCM